MRARIFFRSGRFEGSSVQGWKEGRVEVAILMAIPVSCCLLRYAIAELLHGRDKAPLGDRFGVVEDSCLTPVIGDLGRLHTRLPLDDGFDGLGAAVAVHAIDLQERGFHLMFLC